MTITHRNSIEFKLQDKRYTNNIKWHTEYTTDDYWNKNKEIMIYNIQKILSPKQRKKIIEIYYNGEKIK